MALLVAVLVVVAAGALGLDRAGGAGTGNGTPAGGMTAVPRPTMVVVAGDTLWSIARQLAPRSDPRTLVAEISALNGVRGGDIAVGQRLVLPAWVSRG